MKTKNDGQIQTVHGDHTLLGWSFPPSYRHNHPSQDKLASLLADHVAPYQQ